MDMHFAAWDKVARHHQQLNSPEQPRSHISPKKGHFLMTTIHSRLWQKKSITWGNECLNLHQRMYQLALLWNVMMMCLVATFESDPLTDEDIQYCSSRVKPLSECKGRRNGSTWDCDCGRTAKTTNTVWIACYQCALLIQLFCWWCTPSVIGLSVVQFRE